MLNELRVRNLAVIESLTVTFGAGLNVLTGETGAGKSILVDALLLLLGERTQPAEVIRSGADSATIEAVFTLPRKGPVPALLKEHGLEPEDGRLIVRRDLVRGGRGRVFVNDGNVTLALVERLGEALVEVHGQHEHQALLRPSRHLDLLDAFGGLTILREKLRQRHAEWQTCSGELREAVAAGQDREQRLDRDRAEIAEIDACRPARGEEEQLREERRRLQNAERLREGAEGAYRHLYDDPDAAATRIGRAVATLRDLAKVDGSLGPAVEALDQASLQIDEAVRALRVYRDGIVSDDGRLDEIERRLDQLARLKRKHGDSVDAVLAARTRLTEEVERLDQGADRVRQLAERLEKLRPELMTRATDLAERREQAATRLEGLVATELHELDTEKAVFRVRLHREPAGEGELAVVPEGWRLGPRGAEQAEFLFSANPGEEPRPLNRIASGGELSRTMLAIKAILAAADQVPVLVFDEVDAGIGGKTADMVGRKLRQLARARQVLCITHLPQIACYADHHVRVDKVVEGDRTTASVTALRKEDRVREVARMLGGDTVTDTSLQYAFELISQARQH